MVRIATYGKLNPNAHRNNPTVAHVCISRNRDDAVALRRTESRQLIV